MNGDLSCGEAVSGVLDDVDGSIDDSGIGTLGISALGATVVVVGSELFGTE